MSTVMEIEKAIEQLTEAELQQLRAWFAERDAASWDAQFERDVRRGKLDALAAEAISEHRAGRSTPR
jgi:alkylhydroperoxidase family enzyme